MKAAMVVTAERIEEVLELFRTRQASTQKAAHMLGMSHADFTKLASAHGIPTSTIFDTDPALIDLIFGAHAE